jgi:hypothetical protein
LVKEGVTGNSINLLPGALVTWLLQITIAGGGVYRSAVNRQVSEKWRKSPRRQIDDCAANFLLLLGDLDVPKGFAKMAAIMGVATQVFLVRQDRMEAMRKLPAEKRVAALTRIYLLRTVMRFTTDNGGAAINPPRSRRGGYSDGGPEITWFRSWPFCAALLHIR